MTNRTEPQEHFLGGTTSGSLCSRFSVLTLAAMLAAGGVAAGFGQDQPAAAKPAKQASEPAAKTVGGYLVHQSLEVGGRVTTTSGSAAMWATLVNQGSGGRILSQSLDMHSVDRSKTRFFDSLSTSSNGYGGDPYDASYFNISKGRWYDFAGSFRRDRQYFDYNLLANSLLGPNALVPEPDSLHLFNTVRRNTDVQLTLMPISRISYRAAYNHGTHEGPTLSTVHNGADVQVMQWFRNGEDTYTGGVDVKVAPKTTVSYDQFYVLYKGDTNWQLTGANLRLTDGTPVSLGVDVLSTALCGGKPNVVNGVANAACNGIISTSGRAPMRSTFPSEQLRFSSRYWDKLAFNGRMLYSGATGTVNDFYHAFNGWNSRTHLRQEILTGGLANGRLANNKRINTNGDLALVAELNKYLSVSEIFDFWSFHNSGNSTMNVETWTGTSATNMLTPLSGVTDAVQPPALSGPVNLTQRFESNRVVAEVNAMSQIRLSGGWAFRNRHVADLNSDGQNDLHWHENGVLLGAVVQPMRSFRLNLNFDSMHSSYVSGTTSAALLPSNTFVRAAPDKSYHFRARATLKPSKWINLAVATNDFWARNDDPFINHTEHNRDFSFATTIMPMDGLSMDLDFAHSDVLSQMDICYLSTPPIAGAVPNTGTCLQTATNPGGSLPTDPVANQLYLGNGYYHAPSNFFSGAINYAPTRLFHFNGGVRLNTVNGSAEQLNPYMVPGALQSTYLTPFADLQIHIASQWAWHGNWTHDGYTEQGPKGLLPSRDTHGDILTFGVKYEF